MGFLSFEFVSYFDIRILNLVAAKGRAKKSADKSIFQMKQHSLCKHTILLTLSVLFLSFPGEFIFC
uniref:Uncharacterized protein n=1 Tax=Kuenenia stuttgartiensis TaxID=174633 RepID=Q1Q471_KUEST|nr:unknown protein [Candidatus Kuenenia stuttgartiensis]